MRRKITIFICSTLALLAVKYSEAQELNNPQRRAINLGVYDLLEDYSRYGKLSSNYSTIDETYLQRFTDLFNPYASIFNDILPHNRMDHSVGVQEYLSLLRDYYNKGNAFRLHDIQIGIPVVYQKDRYLVDVHLFKEIYGATALNANYRDTLSLVFKIEFTMEDGIPAEFTIARINGHPEGRTLRLLVLDRRTGEPAEQVQVHFNSRTCRPDKNGRLEFKDLDPSKRHTYFINDEEHTYVRQKNFHVDDLTRSGKHTNRGAPYYDPNEIVHRLRMPADFFVSMHLAPSVTNSSIRFTDLPWEENPENLTDDKYSWTHDLSVGLKTGYRIWRTTKIDLILMGGLEYSNYKSTYSLTRYYAEVPDTFDLDRDPCTLQVNIDSAAQNLQVSGLSVPLHVLISYRSSNHFKLNLETGINLNYFFSNSYKGFADGQVSGRYLQYGNRSIEDVPELGFSDYPGHLDGDPDLLKIRNMGTFYLSPTLSRNLTKSMEIYGGPVLVLGLGNLSGDPGEKILSDNYQNMNPMTSVAGKTLIRSVRFEIGMRYRFADLKGLKNFPY